MKNYLLISIIFFTLTLVFSSWKCQKDAIPNENKAIEKAEKEWLLKFGESIYNYKPFKAKLENDKIWHVYGTLKSTEITVNEDGDTTIRVHVGGAPHIYINKRNGNVLNCYHGK